MTNPWKSVSLSVIAMALAISGRLNGAEELKVIQKPAFWINGQWTRILVKTPDDCGKLEVTYPEQLTLVDTWPHKPGDTVQRFYFRAKAPFKNGLMEFKSGKYQLSLALRVMSWKEVLEERHEVDVIPNSYLQGPMKLPRLFPLDGNDETKTGVSLLTAEELERQREEFSKNFKAKASDLAAKAEDLAKVFYALPESSIPRSHFVNVVEYQKGKNPADGCAVCGAKIYEGRSREPWVLPPETSPRLLPNTPSRISMRLQCPQCKRWFPSNDFAAGDMSSGEFPDDGWDYFDAQGRPYGFIGHYIVQVYRDYELVPRDFSTLYLASGDRRWGRATAVALFRIAEQYLNLSLNIRQREKFTRAALCSGQLPEEGTPAPYGSGFIIFGVGTVGSEIRYGEAMERIWDYFEEEDPVLLDFLQTNFHPEIKSMRDVREFIVNGFFRTAAQGIMDGSIWGNGPTAQAMALNLALFLNTPRSIELVDWAFNNPRNGMRYYLPNNFFKDGSGYESPGYNNAHYSGMSALADRLTRLAAMRPEQYAKANFPLLTNEARFRQMYDHNIHSSLISRTYANVGDDGDLAETDTLPLRPGASLHPRDWAAAFQRWPTDVNYARALWDTDKNSPLKELTDPVLRGQVTDLITRHGPYLELPSQVLDGFGHAILRSGKADDQRALWIRYGSMYGHKHHDDLTIGFAALQRTLLPEQGYHRGESHRTEWDMNWGIHYCGQVVGGATEPPHEWGWQGHVGASLRLFGDGGWAQVATAGRRLWKEVDPPMLTEISNDLLLERTIALVDLGPRHSYAVSLFRMGGGTDHYLSFHGPRGTAQSSGLTLTDQKQGTLAGPGVPYGQKWDSEWGKENRHLLAFPFLFAVQRAPAQGPWSVAWSLEKYPQVQIRLHSLGSAGGEVALSKGKSPGAGKPFELQWVMQHTHGKEPMATQFVEVLEAYEGKPLLDGLRPLSVRTSDTGAQRPIAFQVVSGSRIDTIIHCQNPDAPATTENGITLQGSFGIWSEEKGRVKQVFLAGGTQIAMGDRKFSVPAKAWNGVITRANFGRRSIHVTPAPAEAATLVGRHARITNSFGNDVTHLIVAARNEKDGVELTLELDPRIGQGPVKEIHEDGLTSAVRLMFTGLYYKGKTLSNADGSAHHKSTGMKDSRIYLEGKQQPGIDKQSLSQEFGEKKGDFFLYDYGPGDTVTVATIFSDSEIP